MPIFPHRLIRAIVPGRGNRESSASMPNDLAQMTSPEGLREENARLLAKIALLEERVEQLDELAHQDPLIELPNRRGFMRELDAVVARVRRYGNSAALLFVDLDGLKMINDSFGHQAGDEALIQVSRLLVGGVRRSDCVARIGGDEFAIILDHTDEEHAHETAARLVQQVGECEFAHDGDALPLSIAIGVGMISESDEPEAVMARADREMYKRKSAA